MAERCAICRRRGIPVAHICELCLLNTIGHGVDPTQILGNCLSVSFLVKSVARESARYERTRARRAERARQKARRDG